MTSSRDTCTYWLSYLNDKTIMNMLRSQVTNEQFNERDFVLYKESPVTHDDWCALLSKRTCLSHKRYIYEPELYYINCRRMSENKAFAFIAHENRL